MTEDNGEVQGLTLTEHLEELRRRLYRSVIAVIVGFGVCYPFSKQLFGYLMQPMNRILQQMKPQEDLLPADFFEQLGHSLQTGLKETEFPYLDKIPTFMDMLRELAVRNIETGYFQFTAPPEAFFAHLKVAVIAGLFLVSPFLFLQIYGFVAPGLYKHERRWLIPIALFSALFFVSGALFGYFVVFPFGFEFFAGFATNEIQFIPKLNEYLSFSLKLLIAFGVVFELPLFIFFLARMGLVTAQGLRKKRKYAILIAFITSAVLTPPDPFTQTLMAGPLVILYEVGIWVAAAFGKKKKPKEGETEETDSASAAEDSGKS
ncbi:MAG: twin-arginine translocase subunit TatC [Desulfovibrionales bacterium]